MVREAVQHRAHYVILARHTYVARASIQRFGPQFVVRQPVGAYDAKAGELMMQTLNLARSRSFQIQHQRSGSMPGNRGTDFFVTAGQMNRIKVLRETNRQSLCSSGVILIEDYAACFHTSP